MTFRKPVVAALLGALTALTLFASAVRADDAADEADFRFRRGASLYRGGHLEEALGEFLASNRLVRNRNVIFNIARCFEQLKMFNEAWRFYSEVLHDEMPDADRQELQASLERLKPQLALLEVKTDPPGATVYVNRKDLGARGTTPMVIALKPGKETALIEHDGYVPQREEVTLTIGKTSTINEAMERIYGTLEVAGEPELFELRADADDGPLVAKGNGPAQTLPGHHTFFISAHGFVTQQQLADVPPNGSAKLVFKLLPVPPPSGSLVVQANLDGALIKVDGKEAGFTPGVIEGVESGTRKIEVSMEGREPVTRTVEVKTNQRTRVEVRLRFMQPRVVAAERKLTRAEDAPASITVISHDEILAFGYATLAEALRSVRGLYVTDDHTYQSLGVRGFSTPSTYGNRVLVLNDGHVTNEVSYGQSFIGREFDADLSEVERIEVIRGPGSVLYGSAAFFAVINVVHSTPPPGNHVRAAATAGTEGEEYGHLSLSTSGEDGYLWVRGSAANADGNTLFLSPATSGPDSGVARNRDGEQSGHGDLRARYQDFSLLASYTSRKKQIPTGAFDTLFDAPGTQTIDRRGFIEANYNHNFDSGLGVDVRASYDSYRYNADYNYGIGPGADATQGDWITGEVRVRFPEVAMNHIYVGGELQDRFRIHITSVVPNLPGFDNGAGSGLPDSEHIYSAYLGDEITLHRRLRINAAVRIDDHVDSFGIAVDPRIAVIFQPYELGTTKLIFGQAFRAPGFGERYYTDYTTTAAAPDLTAEKVLTGELEHTHQLTDEVAVTASIFYSRISELIGNATIETGPNAGEGQLQNLPGISTSYGIEAEMDWHPGAGALFQLWYAYAKAQNPDGSAAANSLQQSGALRVMYPVIPGALTLASEFIYNGPRLTQESDPSITPASVGESLRWNIGLAGNYARFGGLRYGIYAQNLLNEQVLLPAGTEVPFPHSAVPQYGRIIRVTLAGTF